MRLNEDEGYEALRERHMRLRAAAQAVVRGARAAGEPEQPLCAVEPHLVRTLRRELAHIPQPSSFSTMSVS